VRAFRRGYSGPGGVSRQYPSLDGIHPRTGYLSTRAAEASLQTAAFATSTIVQMIARLDERFIDS
jgi:hypothetical protein